MTLDEDVTTRAARSTAPDGVTTRQHRFEAALDQALAFVPPPTYLDHAVVCDRCERRFEGGRVIGMKREEHLASAAKVCKRAERLGWRIDEDGDLCAVCAARAARQTCACGETRRYEEHPTTCRRFGARTLDQLEADAVDSYGDYETQSPVILDLAAEIRRLDDQVALLHIELEMMASINHAAGENMAKLEQIGGDLLKLSEEVAVYRAVRAERERLRDWHMTRMAELYVENPTQAAQPGSAWSAHSDAMTFIDDAMEAELAAPAEEGTKS